MGRRKFAKNSEDVRHFRLVARSQNDAHAADPQATPLVLEPYAAPNAVRKTGLSEAELTAIPESLAQHAVAFADPDAERLEPDEEDSGSEGDEVDEDDLDGDCYFPKDGYNYEQHLVNRTGKAVGVVMEASEPVPEKELKIQKPETVEEEAALRALDFDEEYEELEDEELDGLFAGGAVDDYTTLWGASAAEEQDMPDLAAFKAMHARMLAGPSVFEDDEEGSEGGDEGATARPTQAAAASAAEFEEFFAAEYGEEDDVGELEDEEIEGNMTLEAVEEVLDEFIEDKRKEAAKLHSISEPQPRRGPERLDDVPRVIEETRAIIEKHYQLEDEDEDGDTDASEESDSESRTWDCESVLSTLSNVSNRPGKIGKIKVIKKPVAPLKPVKEQEEDDEAESEDDVVELPDVCTERPKGETAEEKKQRKAAVKEMRRICRKMKKESKETFKAEAAKLPGNKTSNGDVRPNARTFRL